MIHDLRREESGHSRSRLRVRERVLGMSCVAALILATDVGYDGVRLLDLDFERRNERILGLDENVIRLPFEFQPDSELRRHLPPPPILAQESFSFGSPAATNPFCASAHRRRVGRFRLSTLDMAREPDVRHGMGRLAEAHALCSSSSQDT